MCTGQAPNLTYRFETGVDVDFARAVEEDGVAEERANEEDEDGEFHGGGGLEGLVVGSNGGRVEELELKRYS